MTEIGFNSMVRGAGRSSGTGAPKRPMVRWPLVLVIVGVAVPFLIFFGWGQRDQPNEDLPSFYTASEALGRQSSPFDHLLLQSLMEDTKVWPYLYSPPSLLIYSGLRLMSYDHAREALLILNLVLIAAVAVIVPLSIVRVDRTKLTWTFGIIFLYIVTFKPSLITIQHGQVNLVVLLALLLFWLCARRDNAVAAGAFLAVAVLLKTYPLLIAPALLLIGRKRECWYTAAWVGAATLWSAVFLPQGTWADWFRDVLPSGGYSKTPDGLRSPAAVWNQSINGVTSRLFTESEWSHPIAVSPRLAWAVPYLAAALILFATVVALRLGARRLHDSVPAPTPLLDRAMLVLLPTIYLLAPFSWEHHLVYLLPTIALLFASRTTFGRWVDLLYRLAIWSAAITFILPFAIQLKFLGVVTTWVLGILALWSDRIELWSDRRPELAESAASGSAQSESTPGLLPS